MKAERPVGAGRGPRGDEPGDGGIGLRDAYALPVIEGLHVAVIRNNRPRGPYMTKISALYTPNSNS